EPLILEVSSALDQATQGKIDFDHSKAMFGMLAVLKTVAGKYDYGSFESFTKIKIHFIHVYGNSSHVIRHWTMRTPEPGVYVMTKEQRATIPVDIRNMTDELMQYVRLHLNLTTLDCMEELQKEHRTLLQEAMINNVQKPAETLLSSMINPSIIRLNEGKHTKEVEDSPRSCSSSPQR
ncbi:MAG: hypothetical protein EXX96DRAFT_491183, partial [Benjaminiella poitrasii]